MDKIQEAIVIKVLQDYLGERVYWKRLNELARDIVTALQSFHGYTNLPVLKIKDGVSGSAEQEEFNQYFVDILKQDKLISELQERAEIAVDELDKLKQSVSGHSSAGVWGSIYYEVSEDEIQKEISDYKNNVKLEASTFTDDEIRDFCIKSLVSYKVGLQSYTNPENKKQQETTIK